MKQTNFQTTSIKNSLFCIACLYIAILSAGCKKNNDLPQPVFSISTLATTLKAPIGIEADAGGKLWVTESGTGHNDGKVSVITPDGKVYPVIINLESVLNAMGETEGPAHLLFADGLLYILGAKGKMYKADVSAYKTGDPSINASSLGVENIGAFVLAYNFINNSHDTHPYGITLGPDGAIYIADAAANAILRRAKTGALSVVAEIPGIANPLPYGPPMVESVPTGIIYDGQNFLVSTLLGFPFPPGKALIYKVSMAGAVSVYQQGFNSLVDITAGAAPGHLVLEHGTFGPTGFMPNTGRLVWANGTTITELKGGLNMPAGLKQIDGHTWYATSVADGSVLKITY